MHLLLDCGQCIWAAAITPSTTDHSWFSSLFLPNFVNPGIAYRSFTSVGGYWELVCCLAWFWILIVVDPDGHLCSSQHPVSGSCCLCGDAAVRSSGSGSECHEANAGADHCSHVCPRIRSHERSRDGSNGTTRFAHNFTLYYAKLPYLSASSDVSFS